MEWAIGKNYDTYRPNTGKLLLPGSHIWWELHLHAVGEAIRDHAELAVYFYPKGEEPKYRTYLTLFNAAGTGGARLDIPPNTVAQSEGYRVLSRPARLENFQPHMHLRGKAMAIEAILQTLRVTETISEAEAFAWEEAHGMAVINSQDAQEGPRAFAEKRTPNFRRR